MLQSGKSAVLVWVKMADTVFFREPGAGVGSGSVLVSDSSGMKSVHSPAERTDRQSLANDAKDESCCWGGL